MAKDKKPFASIQITEDMEPVSKKHGLATSGRSKVVPAISSTSGDYGDTRVKTYHGKSEDVHKYLKKVGAQPEEHKDGYGLRYYQKGYKNLAHKESTRG